VTTNLAVSVARNQSSTTSPNQVAANNQLVRTFNHQITTTSNNLSIAMMTNQVMTAETNEVVSYVTNYFVLSVTNVVVAPTNFLAHDYFLYTELTPHRTSLYKPANHSFCSWTACATVLSKASPAPRLPGVPASLPAYIECRRSCSSPLRTPRKSEFASKA